MTFISPEDGASPIPLTKAETPFLLSMRALGVVHDMQIKWWQAWVAPWGKTFTAQPPISDAESEPSAAV